VHRSPECADRNEEKTCDPDISGALERRCEARHDGAHGRARKDTVVKREGGKERNVPGDSVPTNRPEKWSRKYDEVAVDEVAEGAKEEQGPCPCDDGRA
jgi:hypothetical protein